MHEARRRNARRNPRQACILWDGSPYLRRTCSLEILALTIAIFYAIGTGLGGVAAPVVFGKLIESGSRQSVFGGYVFAAVLMFAAAFVAGRYAVAAERKPLEQVATPLSAVT
jgi:hypothetical protein